MKRSRLFALFAWLIFRLWTGTWRIRIHMPEEMKECLRNQKTYLVAHWHGDDVVLVSTMRPLHLAVLVSPSADGELLSNLIHLQKGTTARGSSSRSAVSGLKNLLRLVKEGWNISLAVDGPKGPLHEVKPGIFEISRLTGAPIFVAGVAASSAYIFEKAWSKNILPWPFARVDVVWTGPWGPITREQDPRSPELSQWLGQGLFAARQQAAKHIAELGGRR